MAVSMASPELEKLQFAATVNWQGIACWSILAVLSLLLYASTLRGLLEDWWTDPNYSHGMIVPFVAAYIVYRRISTLRVLRRAPRTMSAVGLILASQLVFLAGYFGAEFFLQRSSIVLLTAGMILLLLGREYLSQLIFPLFLLELCIPLPALLMNQITLPLQLIASSGSESILRSCGISVYRSGNILQMAQQTLNVGEACSGIRSLVSLVTLAVIMVSLVRVHWLTRIVFVASAAGVAIVANGLRVSGAGLLGYYLGQQFTVGVWHLLEGWLVFVVAFGMLSLELKLIERFCRGRAKAS
jgi:exosortase